MACAEGGLATQPGLFSCSCTSPRGPRIPPGAWGCGALTALSARVAQALAATRVHSRATGSWGREHTPCVRLSGGPGLSWSRALPVQVAGTLECGQEAGGALPSQPGMAATLQAPPQLRLYSPQGGSSGSLGEGACMPQGPSLGAHGDGGGVS